MKKILFAAFAVSLLTVGCQKTEVIHQVGPTDGSLMSFSTEMGKLTKSSDNAVPGADKDGMYNLRAQDFRIWAYCEYTDEAYKCGEIYDGMTNLEISYNKSADYEGDDGTWAPKNGKEYYWPTTGKELRFFALSGVHTNDHVGITIERPNEQNQLNDVKSTLTIQGYTVDNENPNTDLMVADVETHDKSVTDKRVIFNFHHALSKVQFQFKAGVDSDSDAAVKVKSLTVNGIKTIGDISVVNNNISWANVDIDSEDDDNGSFTANLNGGVTLTTQETTLATWLVIPQDIVTDATATDGYKVQVVYEIGTGESAREFTAVFPLYVKGTLQKWDTNQYTKYLVTITPNKITFNAEATDWAPYDGDGDKNTGSAEDKDNDNKDDDIHLQN